MKILLEGNTGDQMRRLLCLFYLDLSFNVKDCYLDNEHTWWASSLEMIQGDCL